MSDRQSDLAIVEMKPAFAWDCPRCGTRNFVAAALHEGPPPEEAADLGLEWQWLEAPQVVRCEGYASQDDRKNAGLTLCNASFETRES